MGLTVKRIKGRLYVYEQYRRNGKLVTKYIGPLEEMVRVYQLYKAGVGVQRLTKRDIRRIAKAVVEEYTKAIEKACGEVNSMENSKEQTESTKDKRASSWWARGDLNPGPPPCQGGVLTRLDDGPSPLPGGTPVIPHFLSEGYIWVSRASIAPGLLLLLY